MCYGCEWSVVYHGYGYHEPIFEVSGVCQESVVVDQRDEWGGHEWGSQSVKQSDQWSV